jgi:hypothetical protein
LIASAFIITVLSCTLHFSASPCGEAQEFAVRHEIGDSDQVSGFSAPIAGRRKSAFCIFIAIELPVMRIDGSLIVDIAASGDRVLGKDCRCRAADETPGPAANLTPQRRVTRRIVNLANEFREMRILSTSKMH